MSNIKDVKWYKARSWDKIHICEMCENPAIYWFEEYLPGKKDTDKIYSGFYCEDHLYGNFVEVITNWDGGKEYLKRMKELDKKPNEEILNIVENRLQNNFKSGPLYTNTW